MKRMRQCTVNNQYLEGKRKAGKEKKDSENGKGRRRKRKEKGKDPN
jgi:hypothetical protein